MVREVVAVLALQIRGRGALGRDEPDGLSLDRVRQEGEGETTEVRAAAETRDHDVRVGANLLELSLRPYPYNRLMVQGTVQDGAKAIDFMRGPRRVSDATQ